MIFDVFLKYNFKQIDLFKEETVSFKKLNHYEKVMGIENNIKLKSGYVTCLSRSDLEESYFELDGNKLIVFGEIYSNKKYFQKTGIKPSKLTAFQVYKLMGQFEENFVHYLKGNFNLICINERNNQIEVISDKLNVLPLYYAYNKTELIISSNTHLITNVPWVDRSIDKMAVAMQYLFDYLLEDYYFFKGIRRIENATQLIFASDGLHSSKYWDVKELYNDKLLNKSKSLELLAKQLKENVDLYTSDKDKILVSLTGGFDGRTNVALLNDRDRDTFLTYSYGMEGSKQINIPREISQKTGIKYKPIILGDEFLESYYEDSIEATYFSNGTAPIGFCNIPYAFKELSKYSDTALTGLFGSEILRPLHNNGIQVNNNSFSIFLSHNYRENIRDSLKKGRELGFISHDISDEIADKLADFFYNNYFLKYQSFGQVTRFFFFIIQEGIRKYFSQEISIERVYINTRIPYFDIDMLELIYETPWAGMYNGFLGKSKFKRRKGQLLYAYIINKYYPELGEIVLDRGYTPNDLLLLFPFNYLKIAKRVWNAKKYMKKHSGNDTFKTNEWAKTTIEKILENHYRVSYFGEIFNNRLKGINHRGNDLTFRHFNSIKLFFSL